MTTLAAVSPTPIRFPDSDGQPMADNTLQFEWIVTLQGNLDLLFRDVPDVFVAGDHLIYPDVEQNRRARTEKELIRLAPDAYVAFGRPKGHRGSYSVREEGGIFPQVVFEVWSPGNRQQQMEEKREFYEKHGAEEYYIVYPEFPSHVDGWHRMGERLVPIPNVNGFVSPRLGIRFELNRGQVAIYHPDGTRFLSYVECGIQAQEEHQRAEQERVRAEQERVRAEEERARAAAEQQRAETAEQRAAKLAARLRELGIDPDAP